MFESLISYLESAKDEVKDLNGTLADVQTFLEDLEIDLDYMIKNCNSMEDEL